VHVNAQDQVENERAEDQPDPPDRQVSPPICEVQRLAIAPRLWLGFVSVVADATPRFQKPKDLKVQSYLSRGGALSIREKIYNFWKRLPRRTAAARAAPRVHGVRLALIRGDGAAL